MLIKKDINVTVSQDAMESTEPGPTADRPLDSVYLRSGAGLRRPQDLTNLTVSHLHGTQGSFHLSQVQETMWNWEKKKHSLM